MIILGALLVFLGGYLVFVGVLRHDFVLGGMGAGLALLAVGIFLRIRAAGYVLAAAFGLVSILRIVEVVRTGGFAAREAVQILLGLIMAWKCWDWARDLIVAQAATNPKLKSGAYRNPSQPTTVAESAVDPVAEEPTEPEPMPLAETPVAPPAKFAWVWIVALGSFIPFGFGVWYYVRRDSKPAPKPALAPIVTAPTPKPAPPVKKIATPPPSQQAPATKPTAKAEPPPQQAKAAPAAAPKPAANVSPTTPAAAPASLPPWKIPGAKPASIEVRNMKLVPLVVSTNKLGWEIVPPFFSQRPAQIMALTVVAGVETGAAEYTVRSSGYAIIACSFSYQGNDSGGWEASRWQPADFAAHGWTVIPQAELGGILTSMDVHRVQVLFWKHLSAGDTGRIRCNKYYPPYFIVLGQP